MNILGCHNQQRNRCKVNSSNFLNTSNNIDPVTLQPVTQPLKPSQTLQEELLSTARQERSLDSMGYSECPAEAQDFSYEQILAEQERHKEILFQIEQYGIIIFAVFFIFFNAFYWLHLLFF